MRLQYAPPPGDSSADLDGRDATQVPSVDHARLGGVATGDRAGSQQQDFLAARGAIVARGDGKQRSLPSDSVRHDTSQTSSQRPASRNSASPLQLAGSTAQKRFTWGALAMPRPPTGERLAGREDSPKKAPC
jgi:hypothetical protein